MVKSQKQLKDNIVSSIVGLLAVLAIVGTLFSTQAFAQNDGESNTQHIERNSQKNGPDAMGWGLLSASIAFGLGAVGAGIAISHVGAAAMGAVAEKPEIAGQALIFVALAEGIVVFGFITALMILGKV